MLEGNIKDTTITRLDLDNKDNQTKNFQRGSSVESLTMVVFVWMNMLNRCTAWAWMILLLAYLYLASFS